jgi:hypothetical protein
MDKDIAAPDELHKLPARTRISGVGEGPFRSVQAKAETLEIRLSMRHGYNFDLPIPAEDYHALFEDMDLGRRSMSWRDASTRDVGLDTRFVLSARSQIRVKHAALPEKKFRHLPDVRRPIDLELRNPACPLVPPRQDETGIVETVIVVEVGQKEMRDPSDVDSCFQQTMKSARTMVENNHILACFHKTT